MEMEMEKTERWRERERGGGKFKRVSGKCLVQGSRSETGVSSEC